MCSFSYYGGFLIFRPQLQFWPNVQHKSISEVIFVLTGDEKKLLGVWLDTGGWGCYCYTTSSSCTWLNWMEGHVPSLSLSFSNLLRHTAFLLNLGQDCVPVGPFAVQHGVARMALTSFIANWSWHSESSQILYISDLTWKAVVLLYPNDLLSNNLTWYNVIWSTFCVPQCFWYISSQHVTSVTVSNP